MNYSKALMFCGTVILTSAGFATATPVDAKTRTVVVEAQDKPIERVSYRDLNLVLASHQKILNGRVTGAVRNVCVEASTTASDPYAGIGCRSYAWKGAKPQIALAIQRAREIAQTGSSSIAAAAITISTPQ